MIHRLKVHGVQKVVNSDSVAAWLDDHGGRCDNLQELADKFHAEYVIHIEVMRFTCLEENSPNLLRGQSEGHVRAYHLDGEGSSKKLLEIMNSDFVSTYPAGQSHLDRQEIRGKFPEGIHRSDLPAAGPNLL